jgi:hypothetical protein
MTEHTVKLIMYFAVFYSGFANGMKKRRHISAVINSCINLRINIQYAHGMRGLELIPLQYPFRLGGHMKRNNTIEGMDSSIGTSHNVPNF